MIPETSFYPLGVDFVLDESEEESVGEVPDSRGPRWVCDQDFEEGVEAIVTPMPGDAEFDSADLRRRMDICGF